MTPTAPTVITGDAIAHLHLDPRDATYDRASQTIHVPLIADHVSGATSPVELVLEAVHAERLMAQMEYGLQLHDKHRARLLG